MEHFIEEFADPHINPNEKRDKCKSSLLSLLSKALMERFPSIKCSSKAPAKLKNNVYVLMEICRQRRIKQLVS